MVAAIVHGAPHLLPIAYEAASHLQALDTREPTMVAVACELMHMVLLRDPKVCLAPPQYGQRPSLGVSHTVCVYHMYVCTISVVSAPPRVCATCRMCVCMGAL
jgi:hypothetical protein